MQIWKEKCENINLIESNYYEPKQIQHMVYLSD